MLRHLAPLIYGINGPLPPSKVQGTSAAMLREMLTDPQRVDNVVKAGARLVDAEVRSKGGISGLAVKAAYKIVTAIKPGVIEEAVRMLLPQFADALDPLVAEWKQSPNQNLDSFLEARRPAVADALLQVTDKRAENASQPAIKKAYQKLRPTGHKHVEAAVPGIAALLKQFVPA